MTKDCPRCEADIETKAGDSGPYQCPECGGWAELEGDYVDEEWAFWLVPCDPPDDYQLPSVEEDDQ